MGAFIPILTQFAPQMLHFPLIFVTSVRCFAVCPGEFLFYVGFGEISAYGVLYFCVRRFLFLRTEFYIICVRSFIFLRTPLCISAYGAIFKRGTSACFPVSWGNKIELNHILFSLFIKRLSIIMENKSFFVPLQPISDLTS